MHWAKWCAVAFAVCILGLPAHAVQQAVAGVEIEYSTTLFRDGDTEKQLLAGAALRGGPRVRSVEVFRAPLAWDIGDGQGHVQVSRLNFAAKRDIDGAVREMGAFVTNFAGQVSKHIVTKVSVSGLDARQLAFEKNASGWRFGGELLVISHPSSNTIWQVQVLFLRQPASANLDQDRILALKVLDSVRVVEGPRDKESGGDGGAARDQPDFGCDMGDSEEKTREVIHAIGEMKTRDRGKADQIDSRFMEAFNRYLEPSTDPDPRRNDIRRHEFCRFVDELLAELNR